MTQCFCSMQHSSSMSTEDCSRVNRVDTIFCLSFSVNAVSATSCGAKINVWNILQNQSTISWYTKLQFQYHNREIGRKEKCKL